MLFGCALHSADGNLVLLGIQNNTNMLCLKTDILRCWPKKKKSEKIKAQNYKISNFKV